MHLAYPPEFGTTIERLPFEWKTRKFRGEFKWSGSSRWKFSGKKVIPFEVLPFFRFHRNDRNFLYHSFGLPVPGFKSRESENLPVFCKWYNSIPFLFSVPKKYQYHLTEILNRNFPTNGKRPLFPISPGVTVVPGEIQDIGYTNH